MGTDYCQMLHDEPDRFVNYILADSRASKKIFDKESFGRVFEKVLRSDTSLEFLVTELKARGKKLEDCGEEIFADEKIQNIVNRNNKLLTKDLTKRVKKDMPKLKGKALKKEVDRRLALSIAQQGRGKLKQITIADSLKPVRVKYVDKRTGKKISYRKTKVKKLSQQERMLIQNSISKNKTLRETILTYTKSGLPFRTDESIKKHYYRLKRKG